MCVSSLSIHFGSRLSPTALTWTPIPLPLRCLGTRAYVMSRYAAFSLTMLVWFSFLQDCDRCSFLTIHNNLSCSRRSGFRRWQRRNWRTVQSREEDETEWREEITAEWAGLFFVLAWKHRCLGGRYGRGSSMLNEPCVFERQIGQPSPPYDSKKRRPTSWKLTVICLSAFSFFGRCCPE